MRTWHGGCQLCVNLCQDCIAQEVKHVKPNLNMVYIMQETTNFSIYGSRKDVQYLCHTDAALHYKARQGHAPRKRSALIHFL